jgi:hypothetical protein
MEVRTSGWTAFSAVMLVMAGIFGMFDGLVAIFEDEVYLIGDEAVVAFDLTTWGWIHFLVGAGVFAAGLAVMQGATWARLVGVSAAFLHAAVTIWFITLAPWWTIAIIAIDVIVIYGLMVPPQVVEDFPDEPRLG